MLRDGVDESLLQVARLFERLPSGLLVVCFPNLLPVYTCTLLILQSGDCFYRQETVRCHLSPTLMVLTANLICGSCTKFGLLPIYGHDFLTM
jgi:hypothetical protein